MRLPGSLRSCGLQPQLSRSYTACHLLHFHTTCPGLSDNTVRAAQCTHSYILDGPSGVTHSTRLSTPAGWVLAAWIICQTVDFLLRSSCIMHMVIVMSMMLDRPWRRRGGETRSNLREREARPAMARSPPRIRRRRQSGAAPTRQRGAEPSTTQQIAVCELLMHRGQTGLAGFGGMYIIWRALLLVT